MKYTKKQIQESIKYWENQLKKMNEGIETEEISTAKDLIEVLSELDANAKVWVQVPDVEGLAQEFTFHVEADNDEAWLIVSDDEAKAKLFD